MSFDPSLYTTRVISASNNIDNRVYLMYGGRILSAIHDVPLHTPRPGIYNMVVTAPRWTNAVMAPSKSEHFNPITQEMVLTSKNAKTKPRVVHNCFPHHGYIWNQGILPQTWESVPSEFGGDAPIEVCEIGDSIVDVGQIRRVKILGIVKNSDVSLARWKVIAIGVTDPLAEHLNDIPDVETYLPGLMQAMQDWSRMQSASGNLNIECDSLKTQGCQYAIGALDSCHKTWHRLIRDEREASFHGLSIRNSTMHHSPGFSSDEIDVFKRQDGQCGAQSSNQSRDKWLFMAPVRVA